MSMPTCNAYNTPHLEWWSCWLLEWSYGGHTEWLTPHPSIPEQWWGNLLLYILEFCWSLHHTNRTPSITPLQFTQQLVPKIVSLLRIDLLGITDYDTTSSTPCSSYFRNGLLWFLIGCLSTRWGSVQILNKLCFCLVVSSWSTWWLEYFATNTQDVQFNLLHYTPSYKLVHR